ncbi:MAG: hypothetical protein FWE22_01935 [Firmicutes bacterium]|nr:hypothetical protein [Bacillota bacterium]
MKENEKNNFIIENWRGESVEVFNNQGIVITAMGSGFEKNSFAFEVERNGKKDCSYKEVHFDDYKGRVEFVFEKSKIFDNELVITLILGEEEKSKFTFFYGIDSVLRFASWPW